LVMQTTGFGCGAPGMSCVNSALYSVVCMT
jgi:hypothetical protein